MYFYQITKEYSKKKRNIHLLNLRVVLSWIIIYWLCGTQIYEEKINRELGKFVKQVYRYFYSVKIWQFIYVNAPVYC